MLVRATSDLHGYLPDIEPCDLLLIAGDVSPFENHSKNHQRRWLQGDFADWLREVPAGDIAWCAGNHDIFLRKPWSWRAVEKLPENTHYLQDRTAEIQGLKVHGSPWVTQTGIGDWPWIKDEASLRNIYGWIPDDTDVLLTHCPPAGFGEEARGGLRMGSSSLTARLWHVQPRLHVFGHVHEGYGRWDFDLPMTLANVSLRDEDYNPVNKVVELPLD